MKSPTPTKVSGYNYATSQQGNLNIKNNALVVHTNQPKGKMVKVYLSQKQNFPTP